MLVVNNPPANAGDLREVGLISGSVRSPGEGNDNPLQYSHLENPMDRGAWQLLFTESRRGGPNGSDLHIIFVFLFLTHSLSMTGFRFICLTITDSNPFVFVAE